MVVGFSNEVSNYNQLNMIYILHNIHIYPTGNPGSPWFEIDDMVWISDIAKSENPRDKVIVQGDIHRSFLSSDNPNNHYWFKIRVFKDNQEIITARSYHFHVCFFRINRGDCINPKPFFEGDIVADVSRLQGYWQLLGYSFRS